MGQARRLLRRRFCFPDREIGLQRRLLVETPF